MSELFSFTVQGFEADQTMEAFMAFFPVILISCFPGFFFL